MIRFICGLILAVITVIAVILIEGGNIPAFIALSPFLLVLFVPFFCVLAVYRFKAIVRACTDPFTGKKPDGKSEDVCRLFEKLFIGTGVLGTLIGVVFVLSRLGDPAKMGPALAVSLLSSVYGVLFYLLSLTWRMKLKNGK